MLNGELHRRLYGGKCVSGPGWTRSLAILWRGTITARGTARFHRTAPDVDTILSSRTRRPWRFGPCLGMASRHGLGRNRNVKATPDGLGAQTDQRCWTTPCSRLLVQTIDEVRVPGVPDQPPALSKKAPRAVAFPFAQGRTWHCFVCWLGRAINDEPKDGAKAARLLRVSDPVWAGRAVPRSSRCQCRYAGSNSSDRS